MTSPVQYILALLAIFGLGTSQVLGLAGGYVCQCSGELVMAAGPDCDTAGCHDAGSGESDHQVPGAPHEHQKVTRVLLGHTFAPLAVDLPMIAVSPALPGVNCPLLAVSNVSGPARPAPPPSGCGPPLPAGVLVARTVVMLV